MTATLIVRLPRPVLVVLVGPAGSGKTTFARKHFPPTHVVSSDFCRALLADDENDQTASRDAFELLHFIARKRLERGRSVVVDATNIQAEAREPLIAIARERRVPACAIVFDLPERACQEWNAARSGRVVPPDVVRRQHELMQHALSRLLQEDFERVFTLKSPEEVSGALVEMLDAPPNQREEAG